MEKTIVQFILDNIFLFVPLGAAGIIATLVLYFLPKKVTSEVSEDLSTDFVTLLKVRLNIYVGVYFFVWLLIFIIGLLSDFLIPTIIGGIIASIPLFVLILFERKTSKSKGTGAHGDH
jgi:hypothetical protein